MSEVDEATYQRRLGNVIVQLRAMRAMSQESLAGAVGRSTAALSRWETGKVTPTGYDLRRMGEILDAPADLFIDPPDLPARFSPLAVVLEERLGAKKPAARAAAPNPASLWMRLARQGRGMSVGDVATALGTTIRTVEGWEAGTMEASLRQLTRLAALFAEVGEAKPAAARKRRSA